MTFYPGIMVYCAHLANKDGLLWFRIPQAYPCFIKGGIAKYMAYVMISPEFHITYITSYMLLYQIH